MTWHLLAALALACAPAPPGPTTEEELRDVDLTYDLAITHRRIEQSGFEAAQAVRLQQDALGVGVGARLTAGGIEVVLREVHGRIRFRAALEPLRAALARRDAAGEQPLEEGGRR